MRCSFAVAAGLFLVSPAFGQAVDAEGAARLSQDLSRYIGKSVFDDKLVTVVPEGNAFRINVDVEGMARLFPAEANVKISSDPVSMLTKPLGDGKWDVSFIYPTISASFNGGETQGQQSIRYAPQNHSFSGVFDPAIGAFLTGKETADGLTLSTQNAMKSVEASVERLETSLNGAPATGGGVDISVKQHAAGFKEVITTSGETGSTVTVNSDNLDIDVGVKGYRLRDLLDLLAFAVAHPDRQTVAAEQDQFREKLRAVLPLWNNMEGSYRFDNFSVITQPGTFRAQSLIAGVSMDGLVKSGKVDYRLGMTGVELPESVPSWSAPLQPTDIELNISGVNLDLANAAQKAIEGMDFTNPRFLSEAVIDSIKADFIAAAPKMVVSRSTLKNADAELAMEGEVTFPAAGPEAAMTFEFTGFDKVVEGLNAAAESEPQVAKILPMAMVIKGFAKTLDDGRLQWAVVAKADGTLIVNGLTMRGPN